jgi:hypothetical protein
MLSIKIKKIYIFKSVYTMTPFGHILKHILLGRGYLPNSLLGVKNKID